ncbi:MAG: anthranilate synthase component I family protein [Bacteroidota bacterium]|nr:anthranilate synthase component I family protein [Ferruginibacter sp.]
MKQTFSFPIEDFTDFKQKMLNWVQPFNIFCLLDNHKYHFEEPAFECLLAVGCKSNVEAGAGKTFAALKDFVVDEGEWLFGHLAYDLKNEMEQLSSMNFDGVGFPDCHFFIPEMVLKLDEKELKIFCDSEGIEIFEAINNTVIEKEPGSTDSISIDSRISANDYLSIVRKLQQHILRGDCYEINFCQEFFANNVVLNPVTVYEKLVALSPNPFSALYKFKDRCCLCASPERYLKKVGNKISSQPIKGTAKRNLEDEVEDDLRKKELLDSNKEKSENVMVVDLVRNDLSKVCKEGTVEVDELFGVYTFPQVHQMISTISGELRPGLDWIDIVKATFPMGSMTGAPKKRVMELIERYEQTKRGLFSGAIGYVDPTGDFDFNVVIRSALYNATLKYLSFQTGSAITFYSDAEKEYEECLLKAEAMRQVLA